MGSLYINNEIKIFEGQLRATKFTAGRRAKMSFNENNYIFIIKRTFRLHFEPSSACYKKTMRNATNQKHIPTSLTQSE